MNWQQLKALNEQRSQNRVQLGTLVDPDHGEYVVGPYQPSGTTPKEYQYAGHPHYDTKAFKTDPEIDMAKALDKFPAYVWVRNKDRIGYGIPLPVKSGSSSTFYPDFLWWVKDTVWAIDPTGQHILQEKVRAKLLTVPPPLKIALLTQGKLDMNYRQIDASGWTLLRHRLGNVLPETIDTLDEVLKELEAES